MRVLTFSSAIATAQMLTASERAVPGLRHEWPIRPDLSGCSLLPRLDRVSKIGRNPGVFLDMSRTVFEQIFQDL